MKNNIKVYDLDLGMTDMHQKVVSLGNFDGVHKGHQKLMRRNVNIAKKLGLEPAVLLFKENSKKTLYDEKEYLTSIDDKIEIMAELGISTFCIVDFSEDFKDLSPYDFIKKILFEKLNTKYVIVGHDYRFGKRALGDIDILKHYEEEFSYTTEVVDFELDDDQKISSRTIRELIKNGEINKANDYLARPYKIRGEVVHGYKRGRELNFPTANLALHFNYCIPTDGVYLTRVSLGSEKFFALTNIGTNPTFENLERKIETYILDFDRDIYGELVSIEFLEFFRGDIKFNSKEELIEQMEQDKKQGYEVINQKYL